MHQILNTKDVILAKRLLNDTVVGERNALLVDLAVSTLVDQLTDRLEVGLACSKLVGALSKRTNLVLTHMSHRAPQDGAFVGLHGWPSQRHRC